MEKFKKILVIIRHSNCDVFLSEPLIRILKEKYKAKIDLLINADTMVIAKTIPNFILLYGYKWKGITKSIREIKLFWKIFKKYDLAINLMANDRSVRYAAFGGKLSVSIIEKEKKKNWGELILNKYYILL